jgi:hypothetical protein
MVDRILIATQDAVAFDASGGCFWTAHCVKALHVLLIFTFAV